MLYVTLSLSKGRSWFDKLTTNGLDTLILDSYLSRGRTTRLPSMGCIPSILNSYLPSCHPRPVEASTRSKLPSHSSRRGRRRVGLGHLQDVPYVGERSTLDNTSGPDCRSSPLPGSLLPSTRADARHRGDRDSGSRDGGALPVSHLHSRRRGHHRGQGPVHSRGHGVLPDLNAGTDIHVHTDADTNQHAYADTYQHTHTDTYQHAHADTYQHTHADIRHGSIDCRRRGEVKGRRGAD